MHFVKLSQTVQYLEIKFSVQFASILKIFKELFLSAGWIAVLTMIICYLVMLYNYRPTIALV